MAKDLLFNPDALERKNIIETLQGRPYILVIAGVILILGPVFGMSFSLTLMGTIGFLFMALIGNQLGLVGATVAAAAIGYWQIQAKDRRDRFGS